MCALMSRRALVRLLPSAALFGALLIAWQLAGPAFGIREYLLPAPTSVLRAMLNVSIPWPTHVWITTLEIVGGFAVVLAVPLVSVIVTVLDVVVRHVDPAEEDVPTVLFPAKTPRRRTRSTRAPRRSPLRGRGGGKA